MPLTIPELEARQNAFDLRCEEVRAEAARAFSGGMPKSQNPYVNDLDFSKVWIGGYAEAALGVSVS
jgi:hypothetical protein